MGKHAIELRINCTLRNLLAQLHVLSNPFIKQLSLESCKHYETLRVQGVGNSFLVSKG